MKKFSLFCVLVFIASVAHATETVETIGNSKSEVKRNALRQAADDCARDDKDVVSRGWDINDDGPVPAVKYSASFAYDCR